MPSRFVIPLLLLLAGILLAVILPHSIRAQLSTQDHLSDPGFWPTKPALSRAEYVGSTACASCHSRLYNSQIRTSMALTSMRAAASPLLNSLARLTFSTGPYDYSVSKEASVVPYRMTSPDKQLNAELTWAFGTGRVGQSFLFARKNDTFREARVTYFSTLHNLDFTPAPGFSKVDSPEDAMYREANPVEVKLCFGCHTTAAYADDRLDEERLLLGVTCEACHGPGAKHVTNMQAAAFAGVSYSGPSHIFDPARWNQTTPSTSAAPVTPQPGT